MITKRIFSDEFRVAISILCILSILLSNVTYPIMRAGAEASDVSVARSNHGTQVKVLCPSNIRVNTGNGNLFYPISILTIPGRGIPIGIFMSYNSGWRNFTTHYGYGWQLSYNMFYMRDENGDIVIAREYGRSDRFTNINGAFVSPVDVYDSLREYEPGKYLLRNKYGIEYYFDNPIHKRLTRIQEPNGNPLTFAYDSDMLLTTITDASGREVSLTYADDKLVSITDPQNRQIKFLYDVNGNLIGITNALGNTMSYSYDPDHFLIGITDPLGDVATITYSDGAVVSVTGEFTNRFFSYDVESRITAIADSTDDGNQTTRFYYDADGRISAIEDPIGNSVSVTWDENNNLITFTDANGNMVTSTYDSRGNILTVTDAANHITTYTYESTFNKLTSVTDANGHITNYEYDLHGNLVNVRDPPDYNTAYTYDSYGNLISKTDANGFTTTYGYDKYGNLLSYLDNTFSYDDIGNMLSMKNSNINLTYNYDALNRVIDENYISFGKSIHYTYDEAGNRISMTDPDGGVTTYAYDKANRLINLTNPLGQTTTYTYDSIGRQIRKDYHNGVYTIYNYDEANRLLSLTNKNSSGGVLSNYTYEYDAAGNRISMTEANGDRITYTYDNLYQLISVTYPDNSTVNYTHDAFGNRLILTNATEVTDYTYDDADRLQSAGAVTYGWDNNGNLISKTDSNGTTNYTYDHQNGLISITFPDCSTNTFTYYPDGRRLSKANTSGETTYYFYDGPNAILETNNAGATIARYTGGLWIDDWISMDRGGLSYYYLYDGLGSVTGLTNPTGVLVATYKYDAFGAIKSQTGSVVNPYTFTSREYEEESGLYYYRSRWYSPSIGRFLSTDCLAFHADLNPHIYVSNNPANYIDPFGLIGMRSVMENIRERIRTIVEIYQLPTPIFLEIWYEAQMKTVIQLMDIVLNFLGYSPFSFEVKDGKVYLDFSGMKISTTPNGDNTGDQGKGGEGPDYADHTGPGPLAGVESKPLDFTFSASLTEPQSDPLFTMDDILPTEGPEGTTAVPFTRADILKLTNVDLLRVTNAVEAKGMDFVDNTTSQVKAVVLGIKTIGETYEHDYSACNRFHDHTLESAAPVALPDVLPGITEVPWFWYVSTTDGEVIGEALLFTVFVDEDQKSSTVDSRWLADNYPDPIDPACDYVFNFQIWSSSSEEAYKLLRLTLENLSGYGTVSFANTVVPVSPVVLIKSAEYFNDSIRMMVQSWLPETETVRFFGPVRYTDDVAIHNLEFNVTLEPGINIIELPEANMLDAIIFATVNGFLDKVYVGTAYWFAFDDSDSNGTSQVSLTHRNTTHPPREGDLSMDGCAEMAGIVNKIGNKSGWVGLGRALKTDESPTDVSQYKALAFFAKGDGKKYSVKLKTGSVTDNDYHQFVFTVSPEWKQYVIPFYLFEQQGWGKQVQLNGTDVKSVLWLTVGAPHESVALWVDGVAFTNSVIISNTSTLSDTDDVVGPYRVTSEVSDDVGVESVSLFYSTDNGSTFSQVPMNGANNTYNAAIPAQPLNTEVRYHIEATDAEGNTATDPVDAPYTTYHFRVSEYLLVDDFSDIEPTNALGGNSWLYPENETVIAAYYDGEALQLDYNVSSDYPYAEYATSLEQCNLTLYKFVSFLVKGANGGEIAKVGLIDSSGNVSAVAIGKYLSHGITTSWQEVKIPIGAFTHVSDWSDIEKLVIGFEDQVGSGAGTIYIDNIKLVRKPVVPIVVDNFNDMTDENGLGGSSWLYPENETVISAHYDGEMLQLDYNISLDHPYAEYASSLERANLTPYKLISFIVKGANGGEIVKIGVKDSSGNEHRIVLSEYLPHGITTSWQEVKIPLAAFTSIINWSNMEKLVITFEEHVGSSAGTIYLDDFKFEHEPIVPIVVDNFNDMTGENGLGSSLWSNSGGGAAIAADYDPENRCGDSGEGYRVSYSGVTGSGWAEVGENVVGLDASDYDTLSLCIKGAKGDEKPNIYLSDGFLRTFVDIVNYVPVTASWQKVDIPLEDFAVQGVNITNLSYFEVMFEWEEMNGTIYLDDVLFYDRY
jgi:RHS repeat-associated protein